MGAEHFDVVVIGAGISGIGAAYHLQTLCPDRSFVILEGRDDLGGTWDLFRYPGVRSDSDMHTLGFSFKPWNHEKSIADGASIMEYLRETVAEYDIARHIRFGHHADSASWSSDAARWTLRTHRTTSGEPVELTCNFLFMCSGYYSYKGGYPAVISGIDRFEGQVVHPQDWPERLDYHGKRVVVIGSGATAVTLVPAMAPDVEHITMLQRSPTYMLNLPEIDEFANQLKTLTNEATAYKLIRRRNTAMAQVLYDRTRTMPDAIREFMLGAVRDELGDELTAAHFTPTYQPWDQRICVVPNGDLYTAIKSGKASVVTDTIDTVTERGIRLSSGGELPADIIITATGLQLVTVGEMDFDVDGEPIDFGDRFTYKGVAYSDVPNLASSFGYIHASWTLRSDLIALFVCRLLNHMRETGTDQCTPRLRPDEHDMPRRPWIADFSAGYMQRMMPMLPKQGDRTPWINRMDYRTDRRALRDDPVDDGVMLFTQARTRADSSV
jgi:monooxygenase